MSGWPSMMALEDNMAQKLFRNNDDDTMIKYRNFEKFDTAYDYSDHYYSGSKPSSQGHRGAYLLRDKIAFVHFRISTLETTLEDIQVRHQLYMKDLLKPTS
ncbi:hypothetical protein Tco_0564045 [Tanacetum coccineum]